VSDTVLIVSVLAVAVILVVFLLRERLGLLSLTGRGLAARVEARPPAPMAGAGADTVIRGNRQSGTGHVMEADRPSVIESNQQRGKNNRITTRRGDPPGVGPAP
jgi:hypothetical protein